MPPRGSKKIKLENDQDFQDSNVSTSTKEKDESKLDKKKQKEIENSVVRRKIDHFESLDSTDIDRLCDYNHLSRIFYSSSKNKFFCINPNLKTKAKSQVKIPEIFEGENEKLGSLDQLENYDELRELIRDPKLIAYQKLRILQYTQRHLNLEVKVKEEAEEEEEKAHHFIVPDFGSSTSNEILRTTKQTSGTTKVEKVDPKMEIVINIIKDVKIFNWRYVLSPYYETIQPIHYRGKNYATEEHAINAQKFFNNPEFQSKFSLDDPTSTFNQGYQVEIANFLAKDKVINSKKPMFANYKHVRPKTNCEVDQKLFLENDNANYFRIEDIEILTKEGNCVIVPKITQDVDKYSSCESNDNHERTSAFPCPEDQLNKPLLPIQSNKIIFDILYAKYTCDPIAQRILLATNQALLFNLDYHKQKSRSNNIVECISLNYDLMNVREKIRQEKR